ncbi:MAG: hypothetical protein KGV51_01025 [Moraxellaceae bacterium]|nr:hypothetical protein [Moraxellaceae bacterium]
MTITTGTKLKEQLQENKAISDDLLAPDDTENISRVFTVTDKPIRLIAYGLFSGEVYVQRVLLPSGTTDIDCHGIKGRAIDDEMPYKIGCHEVKLCPMQREIIIDSTGTFRLQYVGDNRLGVQVISLEEITPKVPKHLTYNQCCED